MVLPVVLRVFTFAAVACAAAGAELAPVISTWRVPVSREIIDLRFRRGDDPAWAARELDASGWQSISTHELPAREGIYWIRWRVVQRAADAEPVLDGIILRMVASYDFYWDGRLVGRNGKVGTNAADERPGDVDALFQIPGELLGPGEHAIALRISSFHTGFPGPTYGLSVGRGSFRALLLERSRVAILSVMAVGGALVVAVVFGLMWLLAGRRLPLLLFSVLFLAVALMQALQAWRWLFEYPYSWHYPRLLAITALTTAMAVLLPGFVMHHFRVARPRRVYAWQALLLTAAWLGSDLYNVISLWACGIGFGTAFALAARAAWRRKRGAGFACGGLALSVAALVLAPRDFLEHAFFISAGPAVLGLLIALVLQLRDERRDARQAQLTAARLEIELLKKNIQPHFVLNTLATIMEIIEQEPRTAVALIEALASEYRILNRVSGEKLIPLGQELELCRAHLHVMSLRKGARGVLHVSGVDERALVPPALFLTLIENGLTHLLSREGRIEFTLHAERRGGMVRYVLLADGVRQPNGGATDVAREGTGLRYIKARLEESFPGRWTMTGGPVLEGWETVIEIGSGGISSAAPSIQAGGTPALPGTEEPA